MERSEVLDWLVRHDEHVHDTPERLLSRCETEVRQHAHEDAWLRARDIAEEHNRSWHHFWGGYASEAYVAREVCRAFADELERNEPVFVEGDERNFVDEDVLAALDSEARSIILAYAHDLARGEEHDAWREITRFTRKRGRSLAREEHLSSDLHLAGIHTYSETALRVMDVLARDFGDHARVQ